MKKHLYFLFFVFAIAACGKQRGQVTPGFYYWKTKFQLSPYEEERLRATNTQDLYVRFFDVDWEESMGDATPLAIVRFPQDGAPAGYRITPVVFITNRTLQHLSDTGVSSIIAANIGRLLAHLSKQAKLDETKISEVQIDCDWTTQTRETYFALLEKLKQQPFFSGKKISATIRMHQIKFPEKSGVPPVDKGLLMVYNMGNTQESGEHNSILDLAEAKKYLSHLEGYPLRLDVALPLFSWCLLFEEGRFAGILRDLDPDALKDNPIFVEQGPNTYRCVKDTIWNDYIFKRHVVVRTEKPPFKDILEIARYTSSRLKNDSLHVLLYHADSLTLSKFTNEELEKIFAAYR